MRNKFHLGIDVGGTNTRGILFDISKNRRVSAFKISTPKTKKAFLNALEEEIRRLANKQKVAGIGVGLPGVIGPQGEILIKAPNLPFLDKWRAEKFFSGFKMKTKIDNDSRCFLRSEALLGSGKKYKNIIALTIGTGIGGGLMINNGIYYGSHNSAGEFGHMVIGDQKSLEKLGAKKAFLKTGDTSRIIGLGAADLINAFDPEILILGGGGVFKDGVKMETVRRVAKKRVMSPLAKKIPIVKGKLGEYSQAIGAALLFKEK